MQAAAGGHLWTYSKHMLARSSPAVPVKSPFEQVHLSRRFGASNLVKTPVFQTFGDSLQVGFALLRECHLIDDEAVAKMGHPVVVVRSDVGYPSGVLSVAGSYNWIKKL
jgi:hypothetical protein